MRLTLATFVVALLAAFAAPTAPADAGPRCGFHRHWVPGHWVGHGPYRHYVHGHCR